jgi:hypothetical protein
MWNHAGENRSGSRQTQPSCHTRTRKQGWEYPSISQSHSKKGTCLPHKVGGLVYLYSSPNDRPLREGLPANITLYPTASVQWQNLELSEVTFPRLPVEP